MTQLGSERAVSSRNCFTTITSHHITTQHTTPHHTPPTSPLTGMIQAHAFLTNKAQLSPMMVQLPSNIHAPHTANITLTWAGSPEGRPVAYELVHSPSVSMTLQVGGCGCGRKTCCFPPTSARRVEEYCMRGWWQHQQLLLTLLLLLTLMLCCYTTCRMAGTARVPSSVSTCQPTCTLTGTPWCWTHTRPKQSHSRCERQVVQGVTGE